MNAQQTQRYLQRFTAQLPNQQWHGILETFDIHRVGKEDFFCLTQAKDLELRKKVWIAATRRPPQAVFSANQLAPSQLNQLACAKARNSANSRQHLPIYKQIIPIQP